MHKIIALLVFCIFLVSCAKELSSNDEQFCQIDEHCACGAHYKTGDCFVGNKNYVNVSKQCPDFCGGIANNLVLKCLNNKCQQISKMRNDELHACNSDADCVPMPGCTPTDCININSSKQFKMPEVCPALYMCSAAYSAKDCACVNNFCINKNQGKNCT